MLADIMLRFLGDVSSGCYRTFYISQLAARSCGFFYTAGRWLALRLLRATSCSKRLYACTVCLLSQLMTQLPWKKGAKWLPSLSPSSFFGSLLSTPFADGRFVSRMVSLRFASRCACIAFFILVGHARVCMKLVGCFVCLVLLWPLVVIFFLPLFSFFFLIPLSFCLSLSLFLSLSLSLFLSLCSASVSDQPNPA